MAAVIAVLSGIGVGSGGLLVIWLTMVDGMDAERARGINLLFFVFSASAAVLVHLLKGRVKIKFVLYLALFASVGTLGGTYLGLIIDALWIKRIFGGMLVISGVYTLFSSVLTSYKRRKRTLNTIYNEEISKNRKFFQKTYLQK